MTVEVILLATFWILVMTLAVLLHKVGKLLDRIEGHTNVVRINLDNVDDNLDHMIQQIRKRQEKDDG
jgi:hypothetical protein